MSGLKMHQSIRKAVKNTNDKIRPRIRDHVTPQISTIFDTAFLGANFQLWLMMPSPGDGANFLS